jgi:hypothetical protein
MSEITTLPMAGDVMIRNLYILRSLRDQMNELVTDILTALDRLSTPHVNLDCMALCSAESYNYDRQRALNRTRHDFRLPKDLREAGYRNRKMPERDTILVKTAAWSQIDISTLTFHDAPEDDDGTWASDLSTFMELIALGGEAKRLRTEYDRVSGELQAVSLWAETHQSQINSKLLHGWYVRVKTSRREVTGWVVSGRGRTVHIQPDPLTRAYEIRAGNYSLRDSDGTMNHVLRLIDRTDSYRDGETVTFDRAKAHTVLLLPPEEAEERRQVVSAVVDAAVTCKSEAKGLYEKYRTWATVEGGEDALRRERSVASVREKLAEFEGPAKPRYSTDLDVRWQQVVLDYLTDEQKTEIIHRMAASALAEVGGPLTPAETSVLAARPDIVGDTLHEAQANLIVKRCGEDIRSLVF